MQRVLDAGRWLVLGGVGLLLSLRALDATGGWPGAALLAVLPFGVLAVLLVAGWSAAQRRWLPTAAAALVLIVAAPALLPRAVANPQPSTDGPGLTIAVANLKLGLADAQRIVDLVRSEQIDVLVTIELTSRSAALLEEAGLRSLLPYSVLEPTAGRAGAGVHSAFPLSRISAPAPNGGEPDVQLSVPGAAPVQLVTTHPVPPISMSFAELWSAAIDGLPSPVGIEGPLGPRLLAGDFNATLDHRQLRDLLDRGWRDAADQAGTGFGFTYSGLTTGSPTPPLVIDHVLVDDTVAVLDAQTHRLPGSDHRMLVVRLQLPAT